MTKTLKQVVLVGIFMVLGLALAGNVSVTLAQFGVEQAHIGAVDASTGGSGDLRSLAITIINYVLGFLGLIAVAMVIYGGITYVTAAGEQGKVDSAKKIIMYAVVGLIIVILSYAIVSTVLKAGTGNGGMGVAQ
ncbi:MAG: hypothetical protein US89_C0001G0008 [Candidatus Peregrinibacteria bacterium GW2011_GWF2_38_29]|nr:MAG: hypothetical protein US89_C0001G0008 [Candidatus Peregrinibacteria bacterium GW2011_GWF2_38_29]HBB03043.1 hypothetical protein [Candidatus Peregrinibacteria bacterium]